MKCIWYDQVEIKHNQTQYKLNFYILHFTVFTHSCKIMEFYEVI